jgi:hypothetical protein
VFRGISGRLAVQKCRRWQTCLQSGRGTLCACLSAPRSVIRACSTEDDACVRICSRMRFVGGLVEWGLWWCFFQCARIPTWASDALRRPSRDDLLLMQAYVDRLGGFGRIRRRMIRHHQRIKVPNEQLTFSLCFRFTLALTLHTRSADNRRER